jgi:hypothetical protein
MQGKEAGKPSNRSGNPQGSPNLTPVNSIGMKTDFLISVFAAGLSIGSVLVVKGGNGFVPSTEPAASGAPEATTATTEDVAGAEDIAGDTGNVGAAFVIREDAASPAPVTAIVLINSNMPANGRNKGYSRYNGNDYYTNAVFGCTNNSVYLRR